MVPSSAVLRSYVWAYGMTTGRVDSVPLVIPLPARPKQLLTFFFGDRYFVIALGLIRATPRRVSSWWVLRRTLGLACPSLDVSTTSPFISSHLASTGCSVSP